MIVKPCTCQFRLVLGVRRCLAFGGQVAGAIIGDAVGIVPLLVIAGCIVAGAVAVYALVLAPRLKEVT
ncbi:MAG: hypothetical protein Q6370_018370 [Candidatus Sigynarchaeota archaeon]